MKKLILIVAVLVNSALLFAQVDSSASKEPVDTSWKHGGTINLNFNQAKLTNWAAGGQSSVAFGSVINLNANYEKGKKSWKNNVQWTYGQSKVGSKDKLFKKTDDEFIFTSKYNYGDTARSVKWSGILDFRTQLTNGRLYVSDTTVAAGERKGDIQSKFLAPGYVITSFGWEYVPNKNLYVMVSAFTGKTTIVADDSLASIGAFGVDSTQTLRFELGSYIKFGYSLPLMDNVTFTNNLALFTGYNSFGKIDVNWGTITVFKINKFLSSTFTTQLIYDEDVAITREDGTIGPDVQFKYVLNIGLMYKF